MVIDDQLVKMHKEKETLIRKIKSNEKAFIETKQKLQQNEELNKKLQIENEKVQESQKVFFYQAIMN